jgi:hypothetical protein
MEYSNNNKYISMAFKMNYNNSSFPFKQTLPEKLKKRMKKTQIFSDEQKQERERVSFNKKLHQDVLDAIKNAKNN